MFEAAVIPFDAYIEEGEYIRYERTVQQEGEEDEKIQERVPKLSEDAEAHEILHFLSAFKQARENLNWRNAATLFRNFPKHLSGDFRDTWEEQIEDFEPEGDGFGVAPSHRQKRVLSAS